MSNLELRDNRVPVESVDTLGLARALIDASNLPLLLFDGDLKLISASRAFRVAFGWGEEAHGRVFFEGLQREGVVDELFRGDVGVQLVAD